MKQSSHIFGFIALILILYIRSCTGCGFTRTLHNITSVITIESPNYPNTYSNNLRCSWVISTPSGQSTHRWLRIEAVTFNTEASYDKVFVGDYPEIHGLKTGSSLPNYTSYLPTITIRFTSDNSVGRQGFKLQVRAVDVPPPCGGIITIPGNETTGTVRFPPSSGPTSGLSLCMWTVTAAYSRSMKIRLTSFSLKLSYGNCRGSQLTVRIGTNAPINMCFQSVNWNADGNEFKIMLIPSSTIGSYGFQFEVTACGQSRTLNSTSTSLTVTSPNYPLSYPNRAYCVWIITAPPSPTYRWLNVTATSVATEANYDFLQVDGYRKISGTHSQKSWKSVRNFVPIIFTSDGSATRAGFTLTVTPTAAAPACGAELKLLGNNTNGTVQFSPPTTNAPQDCLWYVSSYLNNSLDLTLESIPMKTTATSCGGASLYITSTAASGTLATSTFCNSYRTVGFKQHSPSFTIVFFRNSINLNGRGFRFRYQVCGFDQNMTSASESVTLQTIRYGQMYPPHVVCSWAITAPASSTTHRWLQVSTTAFNTTSDTGLARIEDYPAVSGSGVHPATWFSIGSTVHVSFRSGSAVSTGFSLTVTAVPITTICGYTSTLENAEEIKYVPSPRYPYSYTADSNCLWTISAPSASTTHRWLRVYLNNLNTEEGQDFLQVDNYTAVSGRITGPRVWHSRGSVVRIRFTSNGNTQNQGFNLTVSATNIAPPECGGSMNLAESETNGTIERPASVSNSSLAECFWNVSDIYRRSIFLELMNFSLKNSNVSYYCSGANLDVQTQIVGDPIMSRMCQSNNYSVGWQGFFRHFSVRFISPVEDLADRGFRFRYRVCGFSSVIGSLNTSVEITSPRYPENYPHNVYCLWKLSVAFPMFRMRVTVHNLTLSSEEDTLQVVNSSTINNITTTSSVQYAGSVIFIIFQSNGEGSAAGFNLSVTARYRHCYDLNCSHTCRMVNNWATCFCPNTHSWTMGADNQTCIDINECAEDHTAVCHGSVQCINTIGSFQCNCTNGYYLSSDERNCTDRHGGWAEWSPWSSCSASCGGGTRSASRNCSAPTTEGSGQQCMKADNTTRGEHETRSETCNTHVCLVCSDLGCSHTCGMVNSQPRCSCPDTTHWSMGADNRTCNDVNECDVGRDRVCFGFSTCVNTPGSFRCNCTHGYKLSSDQRRCDDRDGGWDQWSEWSTCSKTCGGGQHTATRTCTQPMPDGAGHACMKLDNSSRSLTDSRSGTCNPQECGGGANIGLIAGAAVGGLLLIAIIAAVIYVVKKKKGKVEDSNANIKNESGGEGSDEEA